MGNRYRPLDPRPRIYRNNRRFPLILVLSIFLIGVGSFYAFGSILWRANSLGRECRPSRREAAAVAEKMVDVKMGIVSFAEKRKRGRRNFEGLMETVSGNKIAYAEKHGYDFIDASEMIDKRRPASWSKIIAVKTHLRNYDWVFWNDAVSAFLSSSSFVSCCCCSSSSSSFSPFLLFVFFFLSSSLCLWDGSWTDFGSHVVSNI